MCGVRSPVKEVRRAVLPGDELQGMLEQLLGVVRHPTLDINTILLIVAPSHLLVVIYGDIRPIAPGHIILEMAVRSSKPFLQRKMLLWLWLQILPESHA